MCWVLGWILPALDIYFLTWAVQRKSHPQIVSVPCVLLMISWWVWLSCSIIWAWCLIVQWNLLKLLGIAITCADISFILAITARSTMHKRRNVMMLIESTLVLSGTLWNSTHWKHSRKYVIMTGVTVDFSCSRICSNGTCMLADLFWLSKNPANLFWVSCFDWKLSTMYWRRQYGPN